MAFLRTTVIYLAALNCAAAAGGRMKAAFSSEQERMDKYHAKGYSWPPRELSPDTQAWRHTIMLREKHLAQIEDSQQKWDGWLNLAKQVLVPNFTATGFKVVTAPKELHKKLYDRLHEHIGHGDNLGDHLELEGSKPLEILGPETPYFYQNGDLNRLITKELKPLHEEWSSTKLVPTSTYGVRIYRNLTQLLMHVDRTDTHIVSSIFHIDHHYDNDDEPWPIEIEDFNGKTHEVDLKPGQMLFYESAKCFHGRPKTLKGKYYASVFIHYKPAENWWINNQEAQIRIPPTWRSPDPDSPPVDPSVRSVRGTGHMGDWFSYEGYGPEVAAAGGSEREL